MKYQEPVKIFLSHASEDKAEIAKPLADLLLSEGYDVWYDEYSLQLGDSLKSSIDKGLASCDFGVVILSGAFFSKKWTQDELGGLIALEVSDSRKVVLPVWHKISHQQVSKFSPTLADRIAVSSESGLDEVAKKIKAAAMKFREDRATQLLEYQSEFGGKLFMSFYANSKGPPPDGVNMFGETAIDKLIQLVDKELSNSTLRKRHPRYQLQDCEKCENGKLIPVSVKTGASDGSFSKHSSTLVCDRCNNTIQS